MIAATRAQIGAIHALKARLGLDEGSYRAALARYGAASSRELSIGAAASLIDRLNGREASDAPATATPGRPAGAMALSGPYAGVCRALWLSAWNLGLLRDRTDAALVAFARRQTGLDHIAWMRDPADARRVIEALKGWITREAGVAWPTDRDIKAAHAAGFGSDTLPKARRAAVLEAQWRRLIALGAVTVMQPDLPLAELPAYVAVVNRRPPRALGGLNGNGVSEAELDAAIAALGRKLRKALAP